MKIKVAGKTFPIASGSELEQVLRAIMSNPKPPMTTGQIVACLKEYEQAQVAILKRLAGMK